MEEEKEGFVYDLIRFGKNAKQFIQKCTKPDRKGLVINFYTFFNADAVLTYLFDVYLQSL